MFPAADDYPVDVDVSEPAVERLLAVTPDDVDAAGELTFARNVFIPLTTACRYTCTYCTYYDVPGEATLLSPEEVRRRLRVGADAGCTEALFTFGDEPDERYTAIHDQQPSGATMTSSATSGTAVRWRSTRDCFRTRTPAI